MDLAEYKFKSYYWPPPEDRRGKDNYLFGFDDDNQPYIVRWEKQNGSKGWAATTLAEHKDSGSSAVPRNYTEDTVNKLIKYWADAPCLMRTVFMIRSEKANKEPA